MKAISTFYWFHPLYTIVVGDTQIADAQTRAYASDKQVCVPVDIWFIRRLAPNWIDAICVFNKCLSSEVL